MHSSRQPRAAKLTLASWTLTGCSGVLNQRAMSIQRSGFGCTPSACSNALTKTESFLTFSWHCRHAHMVA